METFGTPYLLSAFLLAVYFWRRKPDPLNAIPTVGGFSFSLLSYVAAVNHVLRSRALLIEGYQKYYNSAFKVAFFDQWIVLVAGPRMMEDLRKRPENELSLSDAVKEISQFKYILGHESLGDPYHIALIRDKLTHSLPSILSDVLDEIRAAVEDFVPTEEHEWVAANASDVMQKVVARSSNRAFVGAPLCRNESYLTMATKFNAGITRAMFLMGVIPMSLKQLVGPLVSRGKSTVESALSVVKPTLEHRRERVGENSEEGSGLQGDMLDWLMEEAARRGHSDFTVVERLFLVNFAAVHSTSMNLTHALYHVAESRDLLLELRAEIELVIAQDGWTHSALSKMYKLDSLLKESQRVNGLSLSSVPRLAMEDLTLCDGTFVPKGTLLFAATYATHRDKANYPQPDVFDPFRFSRLRERKGENAKHQFSSPSPTYVAFGYGPLACPGRFFAAMLLKAVLAHLIVNYDFKLGGTGVRPKNIYFGHLVLPATDGQVLFRQRAVA